METVKGVLILLVLVLLASTFLLFVKSSTLSSRVNDAEYLADVTVELLEVQRFECYESPSNFASIAEECIEPLLNQKDFKTETVRPPSERDGEPGFVVIKNMNARTYDAEKIQILL